MNLMDMIINYKNSIRLKDFFNAQGLFIQIVSLIDIIFLNKKNLKLFKKKIL